MTAAKENAMGNVVVRKPKRIEVKAADEPRSGAKAKA